MTSKQYNLATPTPLGQYNTHMPIGLHVAVGGNIDGAGQPDGYWVTLPQQGKRPVLKSVNNYGPIFEALGYCDQYKVDGIFVFRIATIAADGWNSDVPAWEVEPERAAAYHVERTLELLPPEFDKRVWLEIINEPDKDVDDTRPNWTTVEFSRWLNTFALVASKILNSQGYKVSMFGFSSGEPEIPDWEEYIPFFEYVSQNTERVAIALHEYSYSPNLTIPKEPNPYLIGRFKFMLDVFDRNSLKRPKIHISEFGWHHNFVQSPFGAEKQFQQILTETYGDYPEVEMLALWYFGPGFEFIANEAVKLIPIITELALTWSHEMNNIPIPPPPQQPTPPLDHDLASFFIPPNKAEYGPIYMLTNNWGEGPERTQLQLKNTRFNYITKNGNWERRYLGDKFIYLQVDTSRSAEEWYKVNGPWLPRRMTPGEIFNRIERVTIFSKETCDAISGYTFESAIQFDGLIFEPSPNGELMLCAKFTWLTGDNLETKEESYWYAQGIGLVRWYRHRDAWESKITEFVPEHEENNPIETACSEMQEWIPTEPPTEPPPPEPPAEPPSEYLAYPRGIDISHWQGNLDPEKAMAEGANFVYCKATQGVSITDNKHLEFTRKANAYGMLTGSYHFFDPTFDGALQAEHFIQQVKQAEEQYLPPALDLENLQGTEITDPIQYRQQVKAFLEICEDHLITPIIYTNKSWYSMYLNTPDFDKYDLWIASWTNGTLPYLPIRNEDWLFWQFGVRKGDDYGVDSTTVDVNYTDFDTLEEFYNVFSNNWLEETPTPPQPTKLYPAPRRVDYPRTIFTVYDGMTEAQKDTVWEKAKTLKRSIMFSLDDAGSTPVTNNTVVLYGIPTALHDQHIEWFTTHYPDTTVVFKGGVFYERQPGQNEIASPTTTGVGGRVVARLRRALVRLP